MSKTQQEDARHRWYYESEVKDVEGRTSFSFIFFFFFTQFSTILFHTNSVFYGENVVLEQEKFLTEEFKGQVYVRWTMETIGYDCRWEQVRWGYVEEVQHVRSRHDLEFLVVLEDEEMGLVLSGWTIENTRVRFFFLISDFTLTSLQLSWKIILE